MSVRLDDLPPALRRRALAVDALGVTQTGEGRTRASIDNAQARRPRRDRYRCSRCGAVTWAWAAAERHADEHGHPRVELILDAVGGP